MKLLEKTFEIEKMQLRNEKIEVQNQAEVAELSINLDEKVDLSELQNARNAKIHQIDILK